MEPDFWHQRWSANAIGFHEGVANGLLTAHFGALALPPGSRVFVPLCGKTRDMTWLADQGFQVVGCELSERAVHQYFQEHGLVPVVREDGGLRCFQVDQIQIWQGDLFHLSPQILGQVDAIYDRAALVAFPADMRARYARWLSALHCPQLLITLVYDQTGMPGPPFSMDEAGIRAAYGEAVKLSRLGERPVAGGLKGQVPAQEIAWRLKP